MKKILPAGLFILFILLISSFEMRGIAQGKPQPGKNSIKEVNAAITLEEKTKLIVENGFHMPSANPDGTVVGQTQDKMSGASETTFAISRLSIPSIVVSDGPAGLPLDPIRNGDSSKTLKKPAPGESGFIYELNNFLAIGQ